MSALPPKADKQQIAHYVRFVPKADIAYRQCGPQKGGPPCDGVPLRRAAIGVSAQRPRSLPCGSHRAPRQASTAWHMARRDLGRGGFHAFRSQALQIGMNCLVLGGEDIRTRLCLPRGTFDLLIE